MPLRPILSRIIVAASIVALACGAASAQQMKSSNDAGVFLDRQCREWSTTAKKGADGSESQRAAAANQASADAKVAIELVQFAPEVSDSDIATAVSKFRTCLDKAGKDVFGSGTSVTVSFNPRMKNAKLPRTLDGDIKASPGPKVAAAPASSPAAAAPSASAVAAANKSLGKEWGEACLRQGSMSCCSASATRECKDAGQCKPGVKMCETMVKCDATLNECKKREMATDKSCDGQKCKACTSDYKSCHDNAISASY